MSEFWEKYKHPKWQQKRLRIMEAAGFVCSSCGEKDVTLNVHHTYYEKGKDPWDYPNESLRCLCAPCHESLHECQSQLKRAIGQLSEIDMVTVRGYAEGLALLSQGEGSIAVEGFEHALGVGMAFEVDVYSVIYMCECLDNKDGVLSYERLTGARDILRKYGKAKRLAEIVTQPTLSEQFDDSFCMASTG